MVFLQETGRLTLGTSIAMVILATFGLVGRFAARIKADAGMKLEDWLIIAGFSTFISYVGVFLHGVLSSGGTLNQFEMSLAQLSHALKYVYVAESLFTATITFVKLSILSLYRTIFPTPAFRRASLLVGVGCLVWFFVCFFVNMFQCRPLAGAWELELVFSGEATCIVYGDFIIGYEISNMLLDIIILCLPIWQIRRLQLPTAKKVVIGGVFILGGFVCIVCIIRISYLNSAQTQNPVSLSNGMNWSTVELAVAILCACLPCYGPFLPTEELSGKLDRWYRSWRKTRSHGLNSKGGPGYCRFGPPSEETQDSSHGFTRGGGTGHKQDAYSLD